MIRTFYRNSKGSTTIDLPQAAWAAALKDPGGLLWIDLADEPAPRVEPILRDLFAFHPLTVKDALEERNQPKIQSWDRYLYISSHEVHYPEGELTVTTREVDTFLGTNFLVTHHGHASAAIDSIWRIAQTGNSGLTGQGPDHLLFAVLDEIITDHLHAVDRLDEAIDAIEDQIFDDPTPHLLAKVFQIKHAVMELRRVITPQRDVLGQLSREHFAFIDPADQNLYVHLYEHLLHLGDMIDGVRDLTNNSFEIYLSITSNRQNEVMKALTLLSALFMPLTVITGFFGMNFVHLPFDQPWLLVLALVFMVIAPTGLWLYYRRRGWL